MDNPSDKKSWDRERSAKTQRARHERSKAKAKARKTGIPGDEVPRQHEPVLDVRPFSSVDFAQAASAMPPEWAFEGMTPAEKQAQAKMSVAAPLCYSTIGFVATIDDGLGFDPETVGILLGRIAGMPPIPGTSVWEKTAEEDASVLRFGTPAARKAHLYATQVPEQVRLLLDAAGDARGADNELVLLAVSPDARGKGVARALVDAFEQALRADGQTSYWLQTDTSCSWEWYEHNGFTSCADVELGEEFAMPPGNEDSEAPRPHAFLYRKDL